MEPLDRDVCYRALVARDARFDGRFFVGVTTTRIYCRPVCPATTAKQANCRFFVSAASAQEAGFRPCLRCRPETAPTSAAWRGTSSTVTRALALIEAGELDHDGASVEELADRLGVGARHLRRLFDEHLGASPIAVVKTRRVLFAKQLLHETTLSMSAIAIASGFGSQRRFNEVFRELYGRPPSEIRRTVGPARASEESRSVSVTVRLRYLPPYDFEGILAFLVARAIEGVESVERGVYHRSFLIDGASGTVSVGHDEGARSLVVTIRCSSVKAIPIVVRRVRRMFDLDADIAAIGTHLARDPILAPLVARRPGARVPGGWDEFEVAVRALLGQQVTIAAARRLGSALVALAGTSIETDSRLSRVFPTDGRVASLDLASLGMPKARRDALAALAAASCADRTLFEPRETLAATVDRLTAIRGVGSWTAQYIALRGLRDPDAFPAGDRGLLRGFAAQTGAAPSAACLARAAEAWRPFRAYAAQHLWLLDAADDAPSGRKEADVSE